MVFGHWGFDAITSNKSVSCGGVLVIGYLLGIARTKKCCCSGDIGGFMVFVHPSTGVGRDILIFELFL